jgi:hypothetical protein
MMTKGKMSMQHPTQLHLPTSKPRMRPYSRSLPRCKPPPPLKGGNHQQHPLLLPSHLPPQPLVQYLSVQYLLPRPLLGQYLLLPHRLPRP